MKIGIDIDDVLANFVPTVVVHYNLTHSPKITVDDFLSYNFWEVWGGGLQRAVEIVDDMFADPTFCEALLPINGSTCSLQELKASNAELFAITGRRSNMIRQTEVWIEKHFPQTFTSLHFTNFLCQHGTGKKKSAVCKELGVEVMIEDHLEHALDCANNGIPVLLYDTPWNQHCEHSGNSVRRVHSWDEIVQYLK